MKNKKGYRKRQKPSLTVPALLFFYFYFIIIEVEVIRLGNSKNLKVYTSEEAREYGRLGGLKSAEVRRQKKNMAEALSLLLNLDVKDKKIVKKLKTMGIKKEDVNNQMVMLISIFQKAFKGDVRAAEFIRDTAGQNPNKQLNEENSAPVNIAFLPDYGEDDNDGD